MNEQKYQGTWVCLDEIRELARDGNATARTTLASIDVLVHKKRIETHDIGWFIHAHDKMVDELINLYNGGVDINPNVLDILNIYPDK